MPADVTLGQRAVDRIAQGVNAHIGVGMAGEPKLVRHSNAAQHQRTAGLQNVNIEAGADARNHLGGHDALQPGQILGVGQLDVVLGTGNDHHPLADRFQQRRVIRGGAVRGGAMGRQQNAEAERLRGLGPVESLARDSPADQAVCHPLQRVGDGHGRNGTIRAAQRGNQRRDGSGRNQRSGGIVNQNETPATTD